MGIICVGYNNDVVPAGNTEYYPFGTLISSDTENFAHCIAPSSVTLKNLYVHIATNGISGNSTLTLRIEVADGNQVVTITGSTTGTFGDTSNTDSITIGDRINFKIIGGSGSNDIKPSGISMEIDT